MNKSLTNNIKYNRICNYTYIKVEKRRGFITEKKLRTAVVRSGLECMKTSSKHSTVGTVHVGPSFACKVRQALSENCVFYTKEREGGGPCNSRLDSPTTFQQIAQAMYIHDSTSFRYSLFVHTDCF